MSGNNNKHSEKIAKESSEEETESEDETDDEDDDEDSEETSSGDDDTEESDESTENESTENETTDMDTSHTTEKETTMMLDINELQKEENLSDADYVNKITTDSCTLIQSIKNWQRIYKLDTDEISKKAGEMLISPITAKDFGLSDMVAKSIQVLLEKTSSLTLDELLDLTRFEKV